MGGLVVGGRRMGGQLGFHAVAGSRHLERTAGVEVTAGGRVEGAGELAPQRLPDKYYDFKTSGLKATVKAGVTPVTLVVERLGGKK